MRTTKANPEIVIGKVGFVACSGSDNGKKVFITETVEEGALVPISWLLYQESGDPRMEYWDNWYSDKEILLETILDDNGWEIEWTDEDAPGCGVNKE